MTRLGWIVGIPIIACGDDARPTRTFDCQAIADKYALSCVDHLGISVDTSACALVDGRQGGGLANTIDRAAAVCEEVSADLTVADACDLIFVCVADSEGLSALTHTATIRGDVFYDNDPYSIDATDAWVWVGTKQSGNPGDLEALFTHGGEPWYFKLEDFAERAGTQPFLVDAARPLKLENGTENIELLSGTVTVTAFAIGGAFDIQATGSDAGAGESFELRLQGSFVAP